MTLWCWLTGAGCDRGASEVARAVPEIATEPLMAALCVIAIVVLCWTTD